MRELLGILCTSFLWNASIDYQSIHYTGAVLRDACGLRADSGGHAGRLLLDGKDYFVPIATTEEMLWG
ncbi:hypothetical protein HS088_TW15G00092 [Tripterygium wilfordii]|uniref:Uncharacterized protein n=1 Tax=Tripterygium wilfordii TaxID=458696 RepID=A0A7J7CKL5_TRIWF|nr:hypothetical protein HS088_TW15G00092 [Tripterygium wilfordii]